MKQEKFSFTFTCYVIILPTLALLFTFIYLPVVWAFSRSLYDFEIGSESRFVGLGNFGEYLFSDPTFWPSMLHMGALTFFLVCVRLTIPLVVAKLIHSLSTEKSRYVYRTIFLAPIVVPGVALQLIWMNLIYSDVGLLNETLRAIGLANFTQGWLTNPDTALLAIMVIGFPFVSGIDVLIYYAGLSSIPEDVNESCALEGCVGIRKFFRIDVPLVLSQLKLILILTIINGLQAFENVYILTEGGPGYETIVPGLWMYYNAFKFQRMGYACAIGVVLFLMILTLTIINIKYFRSAEEVKEGA